MKEIHNHPEEAVPQYRLRWAAEADRELIYALKSASVRPYVEKIWGWDEVYQRSDFSADFANLRQFYVIETPEGFGGFLQYTSDYPYLFEVTELHLLPQFRCRGIGSAILSYMKRICDAHNRKLRLGCFKENVRAKAFYERMGLTQTEETSTHYILEYPSPREVPK